MEYRYYDVEFIEGRYGDGQPIETNDRGQYPIFVDVDALPDRFVYATTRAYDPIECRIVRGPRVRGEEISVEIETPEEQVAMLRLVPSTEEPRDRDDRGQPVFPVRRQR